MVLLSSSSSKTTTPGAATVSSTKTKTRSKVKRHHFAVSISGVAVVLGCCCVVSLLVSLLHGSVLMNKVGVVIPASTSGRLERLSLLPPPQRRPKTIDVSLFGRPAAAAAMDNKKNKTIARLPVTNEQRLGHLSCAEYGGPMEQEATQEMVYWQEIPEDETYVSPLHDATNSNEKKKYLTFEPDGGGFNNIRMAMETILALAVTTGRILVLPPDHKMYLLNMEKQDPYKALGFQDFFPMHEMAHHIKGLHIITMDEFLETYALQQNIMDPPPYNQTHWDGRDDIDAALYPYLRKLGYTPETWNPQLCMAAIPARPGDDATLTTIFNEILGESKNGTVDQEGGGFPSAERYVGNPTSVRASIPDRWKENASERQRLCLYDTALQSKPVLHFSGKRGELGGRLLTHFYSFVFLENWKTDLWLKRFIRDHVRYNNEIQCAAARIVQAIRHHVRNKRQLHPAAGDAADHSAEDGVFDAFHVRRGDFQYKKTRVSAEEMYRACKDEIPEGTTVYIATDEVRNKSFFDPLAKHYDVLFLDDFQHLIHLSPNYYGMVDQLVAARSRTFFGCWFSTFTGYINRLRGYYSDFHKLPGFAHGIIDSYYYAMADKKLRMREYWPVSGAFYAREFPTAWRNIDHGIGEV